MRPIHGAGIAALVVAFILGAADAGIYVAMAAGAVILLFGVLAEHSSRRQRGD